MSARERGLFNDFDDILLDMADIFVYLYIFVYNIGETASKSLTNICQGDIIKMLHYGDLEYKKQ